MGTLRKDDGTTKLAMMALPLNRRLAHSWVPSLIQHGISANGVTLLSLISGVMSGVFLFQGTVPERLMGALAFWLANILDECDGEVARRTHTTSGLGSWLDTVSDCVIHVSFFLGLGLGLSRQNEHPIWAFLGILAAVGVFFSYLSYVGTQIRLRGREAWIHPDPPKSQTQMESRQLLKWVKDWLRVDFSLVVVLAALAQHMGWILWGAALGSFVFSIPTDLSTLKVRRPS